MGTRTRFAANFEKVRRSLAFRAEMQALAIAEDICAAMEMKGVNRKQLAESMGVRPSYITKLLSGEANMTVLTLMKISAALGVNLSIGFVALPDYTAFTRPAPAEATLQGTEEDLGCATAA